jgi:hypothetical protein
MSWLRRLVCLFKGHDDDLIAHSVQYSAIECLRCGRKHEAGVLAGVTDPATIDYYVTLAAIRRRQRANRPRDHVCPCIERAEGDCRPCQRGAHHACADGKTPWYVECGACESEEHEQCARKENRDCDCRHTELPQ